MPEIKLSALVQAFPELSLVGPDLTVSSVSTDSRDCQGALFVALKGEKFDGHDFIENAVHNGAVAVLGEERRLTALPSSIQSRLSFIVCDSSLRGLGLMGAYARSLTHAKIGAITGSCGKTTVKELAASILALKGRTLYTEGNFNNDVGVPKTLLRLDDSYAFAVIEQGASHPGDIARTAQFVRPDVALITNAGGAHLEGFGSERGIYKGKSEILEDVFSRGGIGIVPCDSPFFKDWHADFNAELKEGRLWFFGSRPEARVRVSNIETESAGLNFTLTIEGRAYPVTLPLLGSHNAYNAAAAACLALALGATPAQIVEGLSKGTGVTGRLHVEPLTCGLLIDDAYNASYPSVLAALEVLKSQTGVRIFCFGDMGELGGEARLLHRKVGSSAADSADEVFLLGTLTMETKTALPSAFHFGDLESLTLALGSDIDTLMEEGKKVCVLVKGSHFMHMDAVAAFLRERYSC